MQENPNVLNDLLAEGMSLRIEKAQLYLLEEVQRRVENQLKSGLNKKEFEQWFENSIIELKQQISPTPVYKRW